MKKFLIAGLGNIGDDYENTRHNIGFKAVDALASRVGAMFQTQRLGSVAELKHKGRQLILLKPSTYMNLSGKAVKYWLDKEKIDIDGLLVITDDLNLPFGAIRIKPKGSDGGHNGLKDIQHMLQTQQYPRLRFGISNDFAQGKQVDYVLGHWTLQEQEQLAERLDKVCDAILSFVTAGLSLTMNTFNNK